MMVAPSFEKKGTMAAELPCTTTAAALRELSGIRCLLYKIANEDIARDNYSSARVSCVRFSPPDLSRPTEVPLDETGVEFDADKIIVSDVRD